MASQDIEIELKFPLHNVTVVHEFLTKHATPVLLHVAQKDSYFAPAHRDFLAPQHPFEWLRLRETHKGASLDYKHFYPENVLQTDYCDEFQVKVDSPERLRKILAALDFSEIIVVDKVRSSWLIDDVEISLDEVEGLGTFIELEATKHFADVHAGKKHLQHVLEKLGAEVGAEDYRGYPFMLLEQRR